MCSGTLQLLGSTNSTGQQWGVASVMRRLGGWGTVQRQLHLGWCGKCHAHGFW
jgi:hypothetical protein